jgi:molecular chaperone HscB
MSLPDLSLPKHLAADDFELFKLPRRFVLDATELTARWKQLQQLAHPDRFADQSSQTQRTATQWSVRINEAYQRLKNPVTRAAYLCELSGHPVNAEVNTQMSPEFLMQQLQWRECLDEASDSKSIESLRGEMNALRQVEFMICENAIDQTHDFEGAVQSVRKLLFMQRFEIDMDRRIEQLEE